MGDSSLFDNVLLILKLLEKNGMNAEKIIFGVRGNITLYISDNEILLGEDKDLDYKINNLPGIMKAMIDDGETRPCRYDLRLYSEENNEVSVRILDGTATQE